MIKKRSGIKTVTKSTGIYTARSVSSGPDPADMKAVLAAARRDLPPDVLAAAREDADMKAVLAMAAKPLADAVDLDGQLERVEKHARRVLDGDVDLPRDVLAGARRDAETALSAVDGVRKALAADNARKAALEGLLVGAMGERLAVRWAEPTVANERHRRDKQAAKGKAAVAKKRAIVRELFKNLSPERRKQRLPSAIHKIIAGEYEAETGKKISVWTVRRYLAE